MTTIRSGTDFRDNAPVEVTTVSSSTSTHGKSRGSEPVARITFFAEMVSVERASFRDHDFAVGGGALPPFGRTDFVLLEETLDALRQAGDRLGLLLHHLATSMETSLRHGRGHAEGEGKFRLGVEGKVSRAAAKTGISQAATAIPARRFLLRPSLGFPLAHQGWKYPCGGEFEGDAGRVRARRGTRVRGRGRIAHPTEMPCLAMVWLASWNRWLACRSALDGMRTRRSAGAAEGAATLDARHLEAELSALDGGDVAAGAAADDDDVLLLARGGVPARAKGAKRRGRERGRERAPLCESRETASRSEPVGSLTTRRGSGVGTAATGPGGSASVRGS